MVHISIITPYYNCLSLEQKLVSVFRLKDAMVIPVPDDKYEVVKQSLGKAAALYLERNLKSGGLLAVGWGMTLSAVPKFVNPYKFRDIRVVTLSGGLTSSFSLNPYGIGIGLASIVGTICYHVHAPAIAESEELATSFKSDITVRQVLEMAEHADCYMVGIGVAGEESTLVRLRYITSTESKVIRKQGAIGDILAQYFNMEGEKVECPLHQRIVGFPIGKLREKQKVIGVAGGKQKIKAILGALQGGFVNILITDENTAYSLLELGQKQLKTPTNTEKNKLLTAQERLL